jgi:RNA polymerase sigma-70 factor (ECF subfamily)
VPLDADLIAQIRSADERVARNAFSVLFNEYWIPLCKWAYYFTHDRTLAEELVADVLANTWHRRLTWAPQGALDAYLFGAVRTQVRYTHRNDSRHESLAVRFVAPGESPGMGASSTSPDEAIHADDLQARVTHALNALPGRARAAVMYRFYEGLDYAEIAVRLGATEQAVRHLVSRAFRTLRTVLDQK